MLLKPLGAHILAHVHLHMYLWQKVCVFAVGRIAFGCIHVRCVCWPLIND